MHKMHKMHKVESICTNAQSNLCKYQCCTSKAVHKMQCGKAGTFGRVGEGVIRELAQLLGNAGMWWDAQLPIIAQIWVTMVIMMMMMMMMIRMMV